VAATAASLQLPSQIGLANFGTVPPVAVTAQEVWQDAFGLPAPGKLICVGRNYRAHAEEEGIALPAAPLLFAKVASSIVGPDEAIELPPAIGHVDAEAELAVVIGSRARRVAREDALEAVAGFTAANDVSARDVQFADGQWFRGKGYDTFCPLLPAIVPPSDLGDGSGIRVMQRVNGEVLQDASTDELIFDVPTLVAYCSTVCTLEPGDLILTGTPEGVGYFRDPRLSLHAGDVVEVEVEGIGVLRNPVVEAPL
jgi:2-keto-4-pentenoate hydratase/2-oxohepta-3-ene-1,7-dioic acid hydratase in catechol pathway